MFYEADGTIQDAINDAVRELKVEKMSLEVVVGYDQEAALNQTRLRIAQVELDLKAFVLAKEQGFAGYTWDELSAAHPGWLERCYAGGRVVQDPGTKPAKDVSSDPKKEIHKEAAKLAKENKEMTRQAIAVQVLSNLPPGLYGPTAFARMKKNVIETLRNKKLGRPAKKARRS